VASSLGLGLSWLSKKGSKDGFFESAPQEFRMGFLMPPSPAKGGSALWVDGLNDLNSYDAMM